MNDDYKDLCNDIKMLYIQKFGEAAWWKLYDNSGAIASAFREAVKTLSCKSVCKSVLRDAQRYRTPRGDGWHFLVRVRPEDESKFSGGCNSWPAMAVTALDKAIDSWEKHPTFDLPRH